MGGRRSNRSSTPTCTSSPATAATGSASSCLRTSRRVAVARNWTTLRDEFGQRWRERFERDGGELGIREYPDRSKAAGAGCAITSPAAHPAIHAEMADLSRLVDGVRRVHR